MQFNNRMRREGEKARNLGKAENVGSHVCMLHGLLVVSSLRSGGLLGGRFRGQLFPPSSMLNFKICILASFAGIPGLKFPQTHCGCISSPEKSCCRIGQRVQHYVPAPSGTHWTVHRKFERIRYLRIQVWYSVCSLTVRLDVHVPARS